MIKWIESLIAKAVRRQGLSRNRIGIETEDESVARILTVVERNIKKTKCCTFITYSTDGPTARVVMPFRPSTDLTIHIGTLPTSTKARQAAETGKAVLVYSAGLSAGVTAYCDAELIKDDVQRRHWWRPLFFAYWTQGPGDDYAVIRCRPYAFEVFAPGAGVGPAPLGLRSARIQQEQGQWRVAPV